MFCPRVKHLPKSSPAWSQLRVSPVAGTECLASAGLRIADSESRNPESGIPWCRSASVSGEVKINGQPARSPATLKQSLVSSVTIFLSYTSCALIDEYCLSHCSAIGPWIWHLNRKRTTKNYSFSSNANNTHISVEEKDHFTFSRSL